MEKVTKKDLNERLLMVETLLGLHRVLPEQISNKQANDAIFRMQCALSSGKELAGSDLCRAMLERGDSRVVCLVSDVSDEDAREKREITSLIEGFSLHSGFYTERSEDWVYAVPVNVATNEPLTATDVGL